MSALRTPFLLLFLKWGLFVLYPYRPDGHQNNLRSSAYESLMEIVKNSAKDCYPAVQKTTLVIMERLQQVLQMEVRPGSVVFWGRWGYFWLTQKCCGPWHSLRFRQWPRSLQLTACFACPCLLLVLLTVSISEAYLSEVLVIAASGRFPWEPYFSFFSPISRAHQTESSSMTFSLYCVQLFRYDAISNSFSFINGCFAFVHICWPCVGSA